MPILDCDYFEHTVLRKVYRVRRRRHGKVYTVDNLGAMLQAVLDRLDVDSSAVQSPGQYEVLYDGMSVAVRDSLLDAEQFARQFAKQDKVKIRRV